VVLPTVVCIEKSPVGVPEDITTFRITVWWGFGMLSSQIDGSCREQILRGVWTEISLAASGAW
jgi:hypothetical protein